MRRQHAQTLTDHGYELFELKSTDKTPRWRGWRDAAPLGAEAAARVARLGVRLTAGQLVIDVDRHPGRPAGQFAPLDCPPTVWTPHGVHIYYALPPDFAGKIRHTLKELPGVEFKTTGRYVVAPWQDGYEWDPSGPELPAPVVPDSTLRMILRPELAAGLDASGEWSPGELAAALAGLRAEDFREHDRWLQLMCACHEATGGAALAEFAAWSTRDILYEDHAENIAARWTSLVPGRLGNAGVGTLMKILADHGADAPDDVRARDAAADFADVADEDVVAPPTLMDSLCEQFRAVDEDGKLRVYTKRRDEVLERDYWVRYARRDFLEVAKSVMHLPNVQCGTKANGDPRVEEAAAHWLDHHMDKETYRGITFAPEHAGDRTPGGKLNLWQGFSVEESDAGSWGMLKELVYEKLCDWDDESYRYVMNWLARAVQRPWEPGGTALVFRGKKGTGKSTLGRAVVRLFGQHGMNVASPSLLTGRFNAHLRDVAALFADEAFWAGDKTGEGVLKSLITERALTYEGKGQNAEMGRNCVHLVVASNEDWVVPAGMDDERRFAVFEVSSEPRGRTYWDALHAELDGGGLAAMLWELRRRDVAAFDPFNVPRTRALAEQKMRTMNPVAAWLYESALDGWADMGECVDGELYLCEDVHSSYIRHCDTHNIRGTRSAAIILGIALIKWLPGIGKRRAVSPELGRQRYFYALPDAEQAVRDIEAMLGHRQHRLT